MNSSEGLPAPSVLTEPFWRGMSVGRLMALMIPLALYLGAFHDVRAGDSYDRVTPLVLSSLIASTGFVIAVRRRATFREAIVQWSVPPSYLVFLSALSSGANPRSVILGAFVGIVLTTAAVVWRLAATRGEAAPYWPKSWLTGSVVWGFVSLGYSMYVIFGLLFCASPFVVFFFD